MAKVSWSPSEMYTLAKLYNQLEVEELLSNQVGELWDLLQIRAEFPAARRRKITSKQSVSKILDLAERIKQDRNNTPPPESDTLLELITEKIANKVFSKIEEVNRPSGVEERLDLAIHLLQVVLAKSKTSTEKVSTPPRSKKHLKRVCVVGNFIKNQQENLKEKLVPCKVTFCKDKPTNKADLVVIWSKFISHGEIDKAISSAGTKSVIVVSPEKGISGMAYEINVALLEN